MQAHRPRTMLDCEVFYKRDPGEWSRDWERIPGVIIVYVVTGHSTPVTPYPPLGHPNISNLR